MTQFNRQISNDGFSLTELLVVIAIMAIFAAFALPMYWDWQKNLTYRQAASEIASALKTAKSRAITNNNQHRVTFTKTTYQFSRYSSTTKEWVPYHMEKLSKLNQGVLKLNGNDDSSLNVGFNYYGSAFGNYSIYIKDANINRYNISVQQSGKINASKVK